LKISVENMKADKTTAVKLIQNKLNFILKLLQS